MKNHRADPPARKRRQAPEPTRPAPAVTLPNPHCGWPAPCPAGTCRYPVACDSRTLKHTAAK